MVPRLAFIAMRLTIKSNRTLKKLLMSIDTKIVIIKKFKGGY